MARTMTLPPPNLRPPNLRHRLVLEREIQPGPDPQSPDVTSDDLALRFETVARVWAQIRALSPQSPIEQDPNGPVGRFEILTRFARIEPEPGSGRIGVPGRIGWRFRWLGSAGARVFRIVAVEDPAGLDGQEFASGIAHFVRFTCVEEPLP